MRRHLCAMLLSAFVLISALEEAHSSFMDSNGAANKTQPVAIVDDPHQHIEEIAKFDGEVGSETTEETTVFFMESEGRSIAGTGSTMLEKSSSEPSSAGNVAETYTSNATVEETYFKRVTDQMPTVGHSPMDDGLHEMFTSLVNVLAGSDSEVNNPIPVDVNQTQSSASRFIVAQDSDEDSDSLEDDVSDEKLHPIHVLLAQIKQFVKAKSGAGNSPVRSSLIQQDHPIMTVGSDVHQLVVGRNTNSDEEDHSKEQDMSLEVDINLLPEMRRYLKPNFGNREATGHRQPLFSQDNEDSGSSLLETKDILENPAFQQMIRKIDNRLKRASGARGKRLIEKYAEALSVYPLSLNSASTSIRFYSFLSFFFTCFWVSFS